MKLLVVVAPAIGLIGGILAILLGATHRRSWLLWSTPLIVIGLVLTIWSGYGAFKVVGALLEMQRLQYDPDCQGSCVG